MSDVYVRIPVELKAELIRALYENPETGPLPIEGNRDAREQWYERLGWFFCAYRELIKFAQLNPHDPVQLKLVELIKAADDVTGYDFCDSDVDVQADIETLRIVAENAKATI